jgi:hypothetical protein
MLLKTLLAFWSRLVRRALEYRHGTKYVGLAKFFAH